MAPPDHEVQVALGGSVPVPNVQELAKQCTLINIPPRYVRPDQDPPSISDYESLPTIPVIDMQRFLHADTLPSELLTLHSAAKGWGFFQVVNHGVSPAVVEKVKHEIEEFFQLPLKEKQKVEQHPEDAEGYGQTFVTSEKQKLDWADALFMTTHPACFRKHRIFDNLPPSLREALEEYLPEQRKVGMRILEQMARAQGMEVVEVREVFEDGYEGVRMNYYPPCPQPDRVIGSHAHSDTTGLTVLLQVTDTDGLQIRHMGRWIPVNPLPNAFIVNVGDMLEIISNGVYHSVEHRGVVSSKKHRISMATFYNPKLTANVGPAPSLVGLGSPPLFKTIKTEEFFRDFFSQQIDGRSYLERLRY